MIIRFTQCVPAFEQDPVSETAAKMPVRDRVLHYEVVLQSNPDGEFSTIDEHMLLVAQWLRRTKRIPELTFVSVCGCRSGGNIEWTIPVDDEGDMTETCHHGFFTQRLKYLR